MSDQNKQRDEVSKSGTNDLLSTMTFGEVHAAHRFNETCEDGEGYDVKKPMMNRLEELGLVVHKGCGYYEQTDLMIETFISNCDSGCDCCSS